MSDQWTPVLIESPYGNDNDQVVAENETYARAAYHDALVHRGEAPFASHLNYTQPGVLDDRVEEERNAGINAGLAIGKLMARSAFYIDRGFSRGMRYGLEAALEARRPVEFRTMVRVGESVTVDVVDALDTLELNEYLHNILIVNGDIRALTMSPGCP